MQWQVIRIAMAPNSTSTYVAEDMEYGVGREGRKGRWREGEKEYGEL